MYCQEFIQYNLIIDFFLVRFMRYTVRDVNQFYNKTCAQK